MVEIERGPALDRREPFGADAEERTRAEAGVVEVQAGAGPPQPTVVPAVLPAAADHVRVDVLIGVLELVPSDGQVPCRPLRGPFEGLEIGALHGEVVRVGGVRDRPVEGRRRADVPHQVELLPRRDVAGIERQRAVLFEGRRLVPAVPAVNLSEVVIGARRNVAVEVRPRIVRDVGQ